MTDAAVTWEHLSEPAKDAFAWAIAIEGAGGRRGTVGTRGLLIGLIRAGGPNSEPDQLAKYFGHGRDELFAAMQAANPSAALEPTVAEPTKLEDFPPLTMNAKHALEEASKLRAETSADAVLEPRHLFGGILLTKRGTGAKALESLGSIPIQEVRDSYAAFLKATGAPRYRDHLRRRFPRPDRVEWISDATAREDLLQRRPLAASLATRIRRIQKDKPDSSFLVHIDGPWGSGKSTLLHFLEQDLRHDWLVVRYDAWRQARAGPPWWTLLVQLRFALTSGLSRREKLAMRTAEAWSRIRVAGAVYALTLVVLVAAALGLFFLLRPSDLSLSNAGEVARSVVAALTAVGTLVGGALVAGRFLLWESARGARVYEEVQKDPMEGLARHFVWLIRRADLPVIFFVDDLDRCDEVQVVDLLDSIQTLVRDVTSTVHEDGAEHVPAPFFVVAADGAWIRRSYERAHEGLAGSVAEPGRPLGYLYLEKIFQLTVYVPTLSPERQGEFLRALLRSRETTVGEDDLASGRKLIHDSTSEAEVIQALRDAKPEVREALAGDAVEKLTERGVEEELEHDLQRFASLLERNPRAMKRFINTYCMERAVRVLEGNLVDSGPLALWTILRGRWPELAEYLESRPAAIEYIGSDAEPPADMPIALQGLVRAPAVVLVARYEDGGPLTPELLAACCGTELTSDEATKSTD